MSRTSADSGGSQGSTWPLVQSERRRVRRLAGRQSFDVRVLDEVLQQGRLAHVGMPNGGEVAIVPMVYAYTSDRRILVHGSTGAGLLRAAASGVPATFVVTILDGYVLADRIVNNAANYRCAMLFGFFAPIAASDKAEALEVMSECIVPGRWAELGEPTTKEYAGAAVFEFVVQEASLKVRAGEPALEGEGEGDGGCWAGVVPMRLVAGEPVPARQSAARPEPASVRRLVRQLNA